MAPRGGQGRIGRRRRHSAFARVQWQRSTVLKNAKRPSPSTIKRHQDSRPVTAKEGDRIHSLADEQDIYGAQVEVVKEGQGGQSVIGRVLAGIELEGRLATVGRKCAREGSIAYHDGLALVLYNVT